MTPTDLLNNALSVLEAHKAKDIQTIETESLTPMFDALIICTGTSTRHVKTIAEQLIQYFKPLMPHTPRTEGLDLGEWVLIDLQHIVVHVMLEKTREFYRLEQLWALSAQAFHESN